MRGGFLATRPRLARLARWWYDTSGKAMVWLHWVTQISYTDAIDTMASSKIKATPVLDNATMTQHFDFMANVTADLTSNGDRAEIWFDNPETLSSKYSLCKKLGVKGVAFWTADEVSAARLHLCFSCVPAFVWVGNGCVVHTHKHIKEKLTLETGELFRGHSVSRHVDSP